MCVFGERLTILPFPENPGQFGAKSAPIEPILVDFGRLLAPILEQNKCTPYPILSGQGLTRGIA